MILAGKQTFPAEIVRRFIFCPLPAANDSPYPAVL
jgi:hypothetical protein